MPLGWDGRMDAESATAALYAFLPQAMADWSWGSVHTAEFRNATLGESGIGLIETWRNVEYHPTLWDRSSVESASRRRLILEPADGGA